MTMVSKTRNILEDLVGEGSFKWLIGNHSSFKEEFDEMEKSPSEGKNWVPELSPVANIVVRRCSKILGVSMNDLRKDFDAAASDSLKSPLLYSKNLLEYCCFRALALSTHVTGHLDDKKFRRLTFDMMLAWESPAASCKAVLNEDKDDTVEQESFSRIAPAVPLISNVIIVDNLFEVLTTSSGGRLQYPIYEKYLISLERAIKKLKTQTESSLLSIPRSNKREKIIDVDGTVTTQPVLQHVGMSTWPGRLILTDYALYFEPLRVVSYDKARRYDLEKDLKQVVKPEMTGPWGTRLFDKAVSYKSISLSEPVVMEFPELKGHTRRDYWLAIMQEILFAHRFIHKFQLTGVAREEALLKAVLGILRLQAIQEHVGLLRSESLLIFSLCDNLPCGDLILETLASMLASRESDGNYSPRAGSGTYSISALAMASSLGFRFGSSNCEDNHPGLVVGEIAVGDLSPLEKAVKEARISYEKVVLAQETVNGVKVDGLDTKLAVTKELLVPLIEIGKYLHSILFWEDPLKSMGFSVIFSYILVRPSKTLHAGQREYMFRNDGLNWTLPWRQDHQFNKNVYYWFTYRGWLRYLFASSMMFFAMFMAMSQFFGQGQQINQVKVVAPPAKSTMEQLLALQNAVSQSEDVIQRGNVVLLKLRALMLSLSPQASEKCALALLLLALIIVFVPTKYTLLVCFLEAFTRYSPPRSASTERLERRLREWWFSIPAAPVLLEREDDDKKKR